MILVPQKTCLSDMGWKDKWLYFFHLSYFLYSFHLHHPKGQKVTYKCTFIDFVFLKYYLDDITFIMIQLSTFHNSFYWPMISNIISPISLKYLNIEKKILIPPLVIFSSFDYLLGIESFGCFELFGTSIIIYGFKFCLCAKKPKSYSFLDCS